MACCDSIIKCLLFLVNFVFALSGLGILAVGVLAYLQYDDFRKILDSNIASPPIIFMILGSAVFIVAFYGCCGAMCDSYCMLITYGVLVLLILVAQVAVAIVAFTNKTDINSVISNSLMKEYDASATDQAALDFVKNLQKSAKCCAVNGPADLVLHPYWSPEVASTCSGTKGCAAIIDDFIQGYASVIGYVGIGFAVIELLGSISGFALAGYIKRQY